MTIGLMVVCRVSWLRTMHKGSCFGASQRLEQDDAGTWGVWSVKTGAKVKTKAFGPYGNEL